MIISKDYVQKRWKSHERRAAQARAFMNQHEDYILPLRLDDTEAPSLLETTGYIDYRQLGLDETVRILLKKLS